MIHLNARKFWTPVATLALLAGSATSHAGQAQGSSESGMPVVEVVETMEPAPFDKHDYFRQASNTVEAALSAALDRKLSSAVNAQYEWLSARLESRGESRVATAATMDLVARPVLASLFTTEVTPQRPSL